MFRNISEVHIRTVRTVLKGCRMVVPNDMRNRILKIAHETHPGIIRTKQILREKVWLPLMNQDVEHLIRRCVKPIRPESVKTTELPSQPWQELAIDLCGPFPTRENLLVVIVLFKMARSCITEKYNKSKCY